MWQEHSTYNTRYAVAVPDRDELPKVRVTLGGVSETLLWNLCRRALAAQGRRPALDDPKAIGLVERIDYPFGQLSGDRTGRRHARRVQKFDMAIRRFLARYPSGTVVALGEGLETQFWRVDNGLVRWLTVDLPETVTVRRELLPDGPRQRTSACSATDPQWMDQVDPSQGVLITAQGLLMYFQPSEVDRLVELCAERFPGQTLLFDAIPASLFSRVRTERLRGRGQWPPWVWGASPTERVRLAALPGVADLAELGHTGGRGFLSDRVLPTLRRLPGLRRYLAEFPVFSARLAAAATVDANPRRQPAAQLTEDRDP
jgi:O-methyltransferase involved in polyketide biosynthesis